MWRAHILRTRIKIKSQILHSNMVKAKFTNWISGINRRNAVGIELWRVHEAKCDVPTQPTSHGNLAASVDSHALISGCYPKKNIKSPGLTAKCRAWLIYQRVECNVSGTALWHSPRLIWKAEMNNP